MAWRLLAKPPMRPSAALAALLATHLAACAVSYSDVDGPDDGRQPHPDDNYQLETPELVTVTPGQVSVGDRVQLYGSRFVDPAHGKLRAHFQGAFQTTEGGSLPYEGDVDVDYVNQGVADFEFGPNVMFSPTGDTLGLFNGTVTISNVRGDDQRTSNGHSVSMQAVSSILVDVFRAADDVGCSSVTKATVANTNLAIKLRALGVEASPSDPVTYTVEFLSPQANVQYIRTEWFNQWPPSTLSYIGQAPPGASSFTAKSTDGTLEIDPTRVPLQVDVSPPIEIGQQLFSEATIYRLMTGALEGGGQGGVTFAITASNSQEVARRVVAMQVYNEADLTTYDGNQRLVERFAPEQVSACFSGGDIGRDLTYTEGTSESRTRNVSFRWDINIANSVGLTIGGGVHLGTGIAAPISAGIDTRADRSYNDTFSKTFGVDVSQSITTERHMGQNFTAHILPSLFGACYRQTERIERIVGIVYHNKCGVSAEIGKAVLTDWNSGFDVATGPVCAPESNLPPAQVFP